LSRNSVEVWLRLILLMVCALLDNQKAALDQAATPGYKPLPDRATYPPGRTSLVLPTRSFLFTGVGASWHRDTKVFANLTGELIYNLGMSWHRRRSSVGWIPIHRVLFALAQKFAAMPPEVPE
jgi:hypothetical protein